MSERAVRAVTALPDLETPAYLYDLDEVTASHARLVAALPAPSRLLYSLKANPHPAILAVLRAAGCHAEVCSPGELTAALDAGFRAGEVLYTGPGKRDSDLAAALKAGIRHFSADSPHGLDTLDAAARTLGVTVRCLLRVNDLAPAPGQGLTMTGVASQFGADLEWIESRPELFGHRDRVRITGLHLYMGSNLAGVDELMAQFTRSVTVAGRLARSLRTRFEVLNLGGGFPAPFARAGAAPPLHPLRDRLAALLDAHLPNWRSGDPEVHFESGRHLVATSGTLLVRACDVKRSHGRDVVVLDAGINHLGGMSGLRRLPPLLPRLEHAGRAPDRDLDRASRRTFERAIVAGPLCTPLDTWARDVALPEVRPGDLLAVPNVGAYGLYASLVAFLGHPAPLEIAVQDGRVVEVSRLEILRRRTDTKG
ncbi:MAG TPA: type III PLP-dependent enzyme [Micromonosporaceae bacterium]|nr:type III PLP-dependent enzyme [Micromonosporaceae bacterium]